MKLFLTSLTLMILSAISVFAQNTIAQTETCTDQTVEKISSRGINIGADLSDIINLFAETEEEKRYKFGNDYLGYGNNGYKFFHASPDQSKIQQKDKFQGITDYTFTSLDNKIVGLNVTYSKPIWENVEQFAETMIEIFRLPNLKNWNAESGGSISLQCGNYKIMMQTNDAIKRSSFNVYDTRLSRIVSDRARKTFNNQLKEDLKTFKP